MTNVSVLLGGLGAWEQAGFPVETGSGVPVTLTAPTQATASTPLALTVETAAVLGDPAAPVTIYEFVDYQ